MTKGDFENDILARKLARYLLVVEFVFLFLAFILVGIRAAPIAFVLAILSLFIFGCVFTWLYFRFKAFPVVLEKTALQRKADDLQSKIRLEGNKINAANQKRSELIQAGKQELAKALESLQKAYIQKGLVNTPLNTAKIPGIGPKLKERLAAHRILTAADINSNISSIQGFGGAKSEALLSWRRSIYDGLARTKPTDVPAESAHAIRQKYQKLQEENNIAEANAKQRKQDYEANLRSIKPRLAELAPINFTTYLLKTLAPQKAVSLLLLGLLVLVQCLLGSSTTVASIAVSLPTVTFTPTQTYTPTTTLTPTLTNTPTITFTPTLAFTSTITDTPTLTFTPQATLPPNVIGCIPQDTVRETALVVGVIDGDTIDVQLNDQVFRVRYIGINTPERDEAFYNQATAYNQQLVFNKTVTLVKDKSEIDQFDRLLRYVIVGDTFVNHDLVNEGYAIASAYPPDTACATSFESAQRDAQTGKVGLWMPTAAPVLPSPSVSGGGDGGNCDPSYPGVCIPPRPPDLDCPQISYTNFTVLPPDPHGFDGDGDGIGCEG
jgi:micrococcal nuclease